MIAQHIHHTHLRNRHLEKLRTLRHAGTHQQTTIRAAHNRQFLLAGITLTDQIFCRTDKVVKHVLLLHLRTSQMPLLTILITTTQVHLGIDAAFFKEWDTIGREIRHH